MVYRSNLNCRDTIGQVRDFSACYFGGERNKGFATLKNVSTLLPNVPKLLRNQFEISSSSLIYSYSYLLLWLEIYIDCKSVLQENIEAKWASSFKVRAKNEIQEQFSGRLTSQTSLLISCYVARQSAFQFGFLPSKPCLFPLKSSLEFVLHRGKPQFFTLPVKFPADRSKFQFCTTARSKLKIIFA